jgi:hypothetical protein
LEGTKDTGAARGSRFAAKVLTTASFVPRRSQRSLQTRKFDVFFNKTDLCNHDDNSTSRGYEETLATCDASKFPVCRSDEMICYNRRPSRTLFYNDTRQPVFYIDYRSVFCYPTTWQGCSSCSPGRFCLSERRCILEDKDYPCTHWL